MFKFLLALKLMKMPLCMMCIFKLLVALSGEDRAF